MAFERFTEHVTSVEELTTLIGTPGPLALKKELKTLDEHMRRFIAHAPLVVVSTHAANGRCDASPRGDAPGFVQIVDEQTLLIPDRPGNRRLDSFRNILETGRVGLLFLVPGFGETLRINGRAALVRDADWLTPMTAQGKRPVIAIAVSVEECFLQCAKALIRSKLWELPERASVASLPAAGAMLADQAQMPEYDAVQMQGLLDKAYRENLY